jgi:hypothetical protein
MNRENWYLKITVSVEEGDLGKRLVVLVVVVVVVIYVQETSRRVWGRAKLRI